MTTTRHLPVRFAEVDASLDGFRFRHVELAEFAVESAALESGIELHFLKAARSAEAFFIACGDITGRGLTFRFGLGAF